MRLTPIVIHEEREAFIMKELYIAPEMEVSRLEDTEDILTASVISTGTFTFSDSSWSWSFE